MHDYSLLNFELGDHISPAHKWSLRKQFGSMVIKQTFVIVELKGATGFYHT